MARRTVNDAVVPDIEGWILISKDEDATSWGIAWDSPFRTRKGALAFARENEWPQPYRAVRGRLMADPQ